MRKRGSRWSCGSAVSEAPPLRTLCSLPEELLLQLLRRMHVRDMLRMRQTHPCFRDLVDRHPSVWAAVSFQDHWPTQSNIKHFETGAEHGNLEALIKLGIAYLYNEGLPGDFEGRRITANGEKAAAMFCRVETLTPRTPPFCWLFIRPPWASAGACCKQFVFSNMVQHANQSDDASVLVCIAKTLQLLGGADNEAAMVAYLRRAAATPAGTAAGATYMLWKHNAQQSQVSERSSELHWLRLLRDIVSAAGGDAGDTDACLALCRCYAAGRYGGVDVARAAAFVRGVVAASGTTAAHRVYTSHSLTLSMRYILVDWLVEVACMKGFSSLTLHMAVNMVDRYLRVHRTTRSRLQLLGVSAMVLCSRFLGKDIITIREAAWLTDNTYKYEDVVRMMGEITATLRGHIRVTTSLDFVELLGIAVDNDRVTQCLAEYMCELVLLQCPLVSDRHSQAHVAAACLLLARLVQRKLCPWPAVLYDFTGLTTDDLVPCILQLHDKCFGCVSGVEQRHAVLQAVRQRYLSDGLCRVSEIRVMERAPLCAALGVLPAAWGEAVAGGAERTGADGGAELLLLPASSSQGRLDRFSVDCEREQAATPVLPSAGDDDDLLNESAVSGYEGDKEDEGESFLELEDSALTVPAHQWRPLPVAPSPPVVSLSSPAAATWSRAPGGSVWVHAASPHTPGWARCTPAPSGDDGTQRSALRTLANGSTGLPPAAATAEGKRKGGGAGERSGRQKRACFLNGH